MITDLLKERIRARPFCPFVVGLVDGREIAVNNPESIMISPGGATVVAFVGDEDAAVIPIDQVARIRAEEESTRRSRPPRRRLVIRPQARFSTVRLMVVIAAFAIELVIIRATVVDRPSGLEPSALGYIGLGLLLVLGPLCLVSLLLSAIPWTLRWVAPRLSPALREKPTDPPDARPRHGTA